MKRLILLGMVAVLTLLLAGEGFAGKEKKPIKVGFAGDFSEMYSYYDVPMREGAEFAVDEINKAGGILGRLLEFITRDGKNDQALSVRLTEELIDAGVVYLIGQCGGPLIAQGKVACRRNIPISTGDSTPPTLVRDIGECAFQLVMSDNVQGAVAAQYAYNMGYRSVYLISSKDTVYVQNLPIYFRKSFEKLGGKVVGEEQFRVEAGDFSVLATKLSNLSPKPDFFYTAMHIPDTPVFMRQLRGAGVDIPLVSADGNDDIALLDAGPAVNGIVFTTHAFPKEGTPLADFYVKFKEATGKPPASIACAVGYDEIYILKHIIETEGAAEPSAILRGLAKLKDFQGVTGSVTMDTTRRAKKPVALLKVEDGKFVFVDQFYPDYVPEPY